MPHDSDRRRELPTSLNAPVTVVSPKAPTFRVQYGRRRTRFTPPFFAEYANGDHAVNVTLFRSDNGVETIERQGWFPLRITPRRTLEDAIPEVGRWIGAASGVRDATLATPASQPETPAGRPTLQAAISAFAMIAGMAFRRVARRLQRRRYNWNVGVIDAPIETLLDETPPVRWLDVAGAGMTLADPFALPSSPDVIVCERLDERQGVGEIVSIDLRSGAVTDVLRTPEHLSFPFVFQHHDMTYAIPESATSGRITLYRVRHDPLRFVDPIALIGIDGCDPVVVRWAGRWWLFCTRASRLPDVNLFVYFADDLDGPWIAHARNPVKTDVRGARPAGTPFVHEGALYRPAQDCSRSYGAAVVLQRVDVLTPDAFSERAIRRIEPDLTGPFPDGLHTISAAGGRCLVDGRRDVAG